MRLISQKGLRYTDVKYEDGIITIDGLAQNRTNVMYAWDNIKPDEAPILMATYSSRRKAERCWRI